MKSNNLILAILMLLIVSSYMGCKKDEAIEARTAFNIVSEDDVFLVKKAAIMTKMSTVYVLQNGGSPKPHKTIKIRTMDWSKIQEWFYEDLKTDLIETVPFFKYPQNFYYKWTDLDDLQDHVYGGWDLVVYEDAACTIPSSNFHIPYASVTGAQGLDGEINYLASMIGSKAQIRERLNIAYEAFMFWGPQSDKVAQIWYDVRLTEYERNVVKDCGAVAHWEKPGPSFGVAYPVYTTFGAKVRLVREISQAQW